MTCKLWKTSMIAMAAIPAAAIASPAIAGDNFASAGKPFNVTVPATASGGFGSPNTGYAPMTAGITVPGPGTIVITYQSGMWSPVSGYIAGANGIPTQNEGDDYSPLQGSIGVTGGSVNNLMALNGAFVAKADVDSEGFSPVDQLIAPKVGISPSALFFVGQRKSLQVAGAGTLYLGPNDGDVSDDSGSLIVSVAFTPAKK
jgi:hypothetical protein